MSKVLVSGYYGFANAGDEAMLTAIVESLRNKKPDIDITVLSGNPHYTEEKHKVNSIGRFDAISFLKELSSCDLLLSGGGSLLQDVTSIKSLIYYLSVLAMGKIFGKKVMLFSQGIGPIRNAWLKTLTKIICNNADLITVRDDGSYEELKAMGLDDEKIIVTADAVFSLPQADKTLGKELFKKQGIDSNKKVIAFALRKWEGEERFVKEFAKAAEALRKTYDAQIVFVPLQFPADVKVAEKVITYMEDKKDVFVIEKGFNTEEYLAIMSNAQLLIGMRLHALVFAALSNVPFMAISYDPKVDRFVAGMDGKVTGKIETVTAEDIIAEAQKALEQEQNKQVEKITKLRSEANRNIERAIELL